MTGSWPADLVSAGAIAATIVTMSVLRNPTLKALVYSLPLPLSIALVATGAHVSGQNVVGLALLVGFLWLVHLLHSRGWSILVADLVAVGAYIGLGRLAASTSFSLGATSAAYVAGWLAFLLLYRSPTEPTSPARGRIELPVKGAGVFALSFLLLSVRDALGAAVITFPFSGVFAVVEARNSLEPLAAVFTRSSVAMLALLEVVALLRDSTGTWPAVLLGWLVYVPVITLITQLAAGQGPQASVSPRPVHRKV